MTVIEIRPFRNGWQVYESAGVQPVFLNQDQAIDYHVAVPAFALVKIRVLDFSGTGERIIPFDETGREL